MRVKMLFKGPNGKNMEGLAELDPLTIQRVIPSSDGANSLVVFHDGTAMDVEGEPSIVAEVWRKARGEGVEAEELLEKIWQLLGEYMVGEDEE